MVRRKERAEPCLALFTIRVRKISWLPHLGGQIRHCVLGWVHSPVGANRATRFELSDVKFLKVSWLS